LAGHIAPSVAAHTVCNYKQLSDIRFTAIWYINTVDAEAVLLPLAPTHYLYRTKHWIVLRSLSACESCKNTIRGVLV